MQKQQAIQLATHHELLPSRKTLNPKQATLNTIFEKVFVLNLPTDIERRIKTCHELNKHHIQFEIFEAVNGYDEAHIRDFTTYKDQGLMPLNDADLPDIEFTRGAKQIESPGAWGHLKSCEKLIEKAIEEDWQRIFIFEDDVLLDHEFESKFAHFYSKINDSWKVILLGASQYDWQHNKHLIANNHSLSPYYHPVKWHTFATFAIGLDRSTFKPLLEDIRRMDSPIDNIPLGNLYKTYTNDCYVCYPNIVMQIVTDSLIRKGQCQQAEAKQTRWLLDRFPATSTRPKVAVLHPINPETYPDFLLNYSSWLNQQGNIAHHLLCSSELLLSVSTLIDSSRVTLHHTNKINNPMAWVESNVDKFDADYLWLPQQLQLVNAGNALFHFDQHLATGQVDMGRIIKLKLKTLPPKELHQDGLLVSIITPAYNAADFIEQTLDSVLNQTCPHFEWIIVDDGSTDDTVAKIQNYNDDRIKLITQKNSGSGGARNHGLKKATGDIVTFLDADDELKPIAVQEIISAFADESLDCLIYTFEDIDVLEGIQTYETGINHELCNQTYTSNKALYLFLQQKFYPTPWNKAFRRQLFEINENLRFLTRICFEDLGFTPCLLAACQQVKLIKKDLVIYKKRSGSLTNSCDEKHAMSLAIVFSQIGDCMKRIKLFDQYADAFWNMVFHHISINYQLRGHLFDIYLNEKFISGIIQTLQKFEWDRERSLAYSQQVNALIALITQKSTKINKQDLKRLRASLQKPRPLYSWTKKIKMAVKQPSLLVDRLLLTNRGLLAAGIGSFSLLFIGLLLSGGHAFLSFALSVVMASVCCTVLLLWRDTRRSLHRTADLYSLIHSSSSQTDDAIKAIKQEYKQITDHQIDETKLQFNQMANDVHFDFRRQIEVLKNDQEKPANE